MYVVLWKVHVILLVLGIVPRVFTLEIRCNIESTHYYSFFLLWLMLIVVHIKYISLKASAFQIWGLSEETIYKTCIKSKPLLQTSSLFRHILVISGLKSVTTDSLDRARAVLQLLDCLLSVDLIPRTAKTCIIQHSGDSGRRIICSKPFSATKQIQGCLGLQETVSQNSSSNNNAGCGGCCYNPSPLGQRVRTLKSAAAS